MSQKKFLKLLEEKLQILSEEERKDILNEYKDTIEEKVRHGKRVEEAVADFGSVEELSREILKAYKINPDYVNNKDKAKDIVEEGENMIKKGAEKLSSLTQDVVEDFKNSDNNWTLEMVFEVVIKAILLLIGLSLLRIPFYIIEGLGMNILKVSFLPFSSLFQVILRCLIGIIYFVVCIIIGMIVLKPYFINNQKDAKKKESNQSGNVVQKETGFGRTIIEILKAFVFLFTVFPLYFIDFGCYIAVAVLIYLLVEGIPVLGLIFIVLAISIFFTFLTKVFYNLLYGKKRIYCYSLILSAILFVSGCFLTVSIATDFEVYDRIPDDVFAKSEIVYEKTIHGKYFAIPYWESKTEIDSSLADDKIEIIVSYYSDFVKEVKNMDTVVEDTDIFDLDVSHQALDKKARKKLYQKIKNELKKLRWYHYSDMGDLEITIRGNEKTLAKLK